eukprot:TRINITY_DN14615_c0_g1_i2.p3 TRINITY_DN14615_c0_g1~~TRINITY_DN14615_c0_g1_i2.p3  ORF type:complete len:135 (+),score=8.76 TRINITY_DN14615_c0_g1_i2:3-407(+)
MSSSHCRIFVAYSGRSTTFIYVSHFVLFFFFFFNDTATTEIYTLHIVGSVRCVQETDDRLHLICQQVVGKLNAKRPYGTIRTVSRLIYIKGEKKNIIRSTYFTKRPDTNNIRDNPIRIATVAQPTRLIIGLLTC